jgi:hypothetical protein
VAETDLSNGFPFHTVGILLINARLFPIRRVVGVERQTVFADVVSVALALDLGFDAVVAWSTKALQLAGYERVPVTTMRDDVVGDFCRASNSLVGAVTTKRMVRELEL